MDVLLPDARRAARRRTRRRGTSLLSTRRKNLPRPFDFLRSVCFAAVTLSFGAVLGGCSGAPSAPTEVLTFDFDFSRGPQGFTAGFADYAAGDEAFHELTSDYRALPAPLGPRSALFLSGVNRSADLFMFYKGAVGGLPPGARYRVSVGLEIATDTPAGCAGIGGAPGEAVWIKAGATAREPLPIIAGAYLRMNVDIGNQSAGGAQAVVLGDVANARRCEQPLEWERKSFPSRATPEPLLVPPDGRAWLLFGADSGFEGRTAIYFTRASVTFTPL